MSENGSQPDARQSRVAEKQICAALLDIAVCVRNVGLYGRHHPLIGSSARKALESVGPLLASSSSIAIVVSDNFLAHDNFPLHDESGSLAEFAVALRQRGIDELRLHAGLDCEETVRFAEMMCLAPEELLLRGGASTELQRGEIRHIETRAGALPAESRLARDPAEIYEEALVLIEEAMLAIQSGLDMPVCEIRSVVSDSLQSLTADESALLALQGIRTYDRYLSEHSVNVCILSMMLSRDLGIDSGQVLELGIAAMLHDVGKVFVPGDVVRKPGRLSEEEWEQIRRHPVEGARALAGLPDLPPLAATIALEHHVKADGSGYPALGPRQKPHLLSRLVAIVDTYDALTTRRPYREQWTAQEAIAWMLYESWGQYDRQLLARFASKSNLYPIGSLVKLNGGQAAVVTAGSRSNPTRPTIRLLKDRRVIELAANTDPEFDIAAVAQPVEALLPYVDTLAA